MSFFGSLLSRITGRGSSDAAPGTPAAQALADAAAAGTALSGVDVAGILSDMAGKAGQQLNWQSSIVDLMKLVGMDSSLANREALAKELGYTGPLGGSAEMNTWLHKTVMAKIAANGGKLPPGLA
jgi:Domain of unknown function (DUF3597)